MTAHALAALLALVPGAALWAAYPRRPWAAAAGLGAALAAGAAAVALAPEGLRLAALLSGSSAAAACGLA
ncbi:MAG: hypothetical protein HY079_08640, partial [Elusimicrobia bacterium]|nr:hypothetical protein [Elusimicrobiota bacterium]